MSAHLPEMLAQQLTRTEVAVGVLLRASEMQRAMVEGALLAALARAEAGAALLLRAAERGAEPDLMAAEDHRAAVLGDVLDALDLVALPIEAATDQPLGTRLLAAMYPFSRPAEAEEPR